MLDINLLKQRLHFVNDKLKTRNFNLDINKFCELEEQRKDLQTEVETLKAKRNANAKEIGCAKAQNKDAELLFSEAQLIAENLNLKEKKFADICLELNAILENIPNLPHESVPVGPNETSNVEMRRWGKIREFDFPIKDHVDLGEALGYMDFETAAKVASSRFVFLYGSLARLHRALIQFMLDVHTQDHGYQEVYSPYLVNQKSLFGTGQLPKFYNDQFNIAGDKKLSLIPTAEVPVTNIVRNEILSCDDLPKKFVCHTPCFRSESGSYGKDTRGMIRHHQFEKVELVQIVKPKDSYRVLEELTNHAEVILRKLELPYRVVALSTGDLGFSSAKTYDLEVWFPSQKTYREISSCSNFEGFQARRMKARWRNPETKKLELVHTLNGSALAIGRTLIAIMENYQDSAGHINIPNVLKPYMDNLEKF